MLLHISIDRMQQNRTDEDRVFAIVCESFEKNNAILLKALKMHIEEDPTSEHQHEAPFQRLIKNQSSKVNSITYR